MACGGQMPIFGSNYWRSHGFQTTVMKCPQVVCCHQRGIFPDASSASLNIRPKWFDGLSPRMQQQRCSNSNEGCGSLWLLLRSSNSCSFIFDTIILPRTFRTHHPPNFHHSRQGTTRLFDSSQQSIMLDVLWGVTQLWHPEPWIWSYCRCIQKSVIAHQALHILKKTLLM